MFGRDGELKRLNDDRNNSRLSKFVRQQADKAYHEIVRQLKDRKLMGMRLQLINASRAHDSVTAEKIQLQMRDYLKQDKETGE